MGVQGVNTRLYISVHSLCSFKLFFMCPKELELYILWGAEIVIEVDESLFHHSPEVNPLTPVVSKNYLVSP